MLGTEDTISLSALTKVLSRTLSPANQAAVLEDILQNELGWNDSETMIVQRIEVLREIRRGEG